MRIQIHYLDYLEKTGFMLNKACPSQMSTKIRWCLNAKVSKQNNKSTQVNKKTINCLENNSKDF